MSEREARLKQEWHIPPSARLVRAAGHAAVISLDDEYDPPPESGRRAAFIADLERLRTAENDSVAHDRSIRL